jgi:putative tryptophan/tyrosine transport system substrate-binding protein
VIERRAFIAALAVGGAFASRPAHAQKAEGMPVIGWLSPASAHDGLANLQALRAGLGELGYVEGESLIIEARSAEGRSEQLPRLAGELVRFPVRVLCSAGCKPPRRSSLTSSGARKISRASASRSPRDGPTRS